MNYSDITTSNLTTKQVELLLMLISKENKIIKNQGFQIIKDWSDKFKNKFLKENGYFPYYRKDGKVYGYHQVLEMMGFEKPYPGRKWPEPIFPEPTKIKKLEGNI